MAIDPVLLAAAVPVAPGEAVLDAGLGTGAVAACLLARVPGCRVTGVEVQPDMALLAGRTAMLNGWELEAVTADLLDPPPELRRRRFDHVASNPPFLGPGEGTASPAPGRALAHGGAALGPWLDACLRRVAPGGRLTLIHRADRLDLVLAALAGRLGGIVVHPLWPAAGEPARRVLVGGRKGSRAPMRLTAGLVLHGADGAYTAEAEAVLREGEALVMGH